MIFQARQGDVLVQQVRKRARRGRAVGERGRLILAYGERTGHAHEVIAAAQDGGGGVAAQMFEESDGARYLFVARACVLTHDEHGPIALAPGAYSVTIQREYEPDGMRPVLD